MLKRNDIISIKNNVENTFGINKGILYINYLTNNESLLLKNNVDAIKKYEFKTNVKNINASLTRHISEKNPHKITKYVIGLENVDNTSDIDKIVSTQLNNKLKEKFSISDIYDSIENSESKNLTNVPLSAAQGKVINETIEGLNDKNITEKLSKRIELIENILKNNVI